MFTVKRSEQNPLISPTPHSTWSSSAVFNPSPAEYKKTEVLLYRAMGEPDPLRGNTRVSVVGKSTKNKAGVYSDRTIFIDSDMDFDTYGAEDPRITKFGDTYYIFYTAIGSFPFTADTIRVALARSKDLETIQDKHLVTPFNAKAMTLFPELVNGKLSALLTVHTDREDSEICFVQFEKEEDMWSPEFWNTWHASYKEHALSIRRNDADRVEVGAVPLKVDGGWLLIYSHIQHYFEGRAVFGIEAILLDSKDPKKIIGRTKGPLFVPELYYEKVGMISNVVFPSGAKIVDSRLHIYYGAADTHCAEASLPLAPLLAEMQSETSSVFVRYDKNPILSPRDGVAFEEWGTINPATIDLDGDIHIIYRAVAQDNVSTFGHAITQDGYTITSRDAQPIRLPEGACEVRKDEPKNYGIEDPRVVEIDNTLYFTYTSFNGQVPRVSVSSIPTKDFKKGAYDSWTQSVPISPDYIDDKDAIIFPEKFKQGYGIIHRIGLNICMDFLPSLDFKEPIIKCIELCQPRRGMWDSQKVGISTPAIKTKKGWLLLYHGISDHKVYRVGAMLVDLKDPTKVLARTATPIFEPFADYEVKGVVNKVVFPCGVVVRGKKVLIYYGSADRVTGVAETTIEKLLATLE